jgi:hypothetical protein
MKIVKQADVIMDQARGLYEEFEDTMEPTDRIVASDSIIIAEDFRQGVEEKFWPAKRTQAKLYLNQAQGALETVKRSVDETEI